MSNFSSPVYIIDASDHIIFAIPWLWLRFGVVFDGHGQLDPQPLRPPPLPSSAPPVVVVVGDSLFGGEDALPDGATPAAAAESGEDDIAAVDGDRIDAAHPFHVGGVLFCEPNQ